jgi:hypothetical protein
MAYGELKFGLDEETLSRLDDLTVQLRQIAIALAPQVRITIDESLAQVRPAKTEAQAFVNDDGQPMSFGERSINADAESEVTLARQVRKTVARAALERPSQEQSIVDDLVNWIYDVWLPQQKKQWQDKIDHIQKMRVVNVDPPRHFPAVVRPDKVTVTVGDRTVGTFVHLKNSGKWEVTTPLRVFGSVKSRTVASWPSLVEAVHAVMAETSWDDITDVPVWISWSIPLDGTRPESTVDPEVEDELEDDE